MKRIRSGAIWDNPSQRTDTQRPSARCAKPAAVRSRGNGVLPFDRGSRSAPGPRDLAPTGANDLTCACRSPAMPLGRDQPAGTAGRGVWTGSSIKWTGRRVPRRQHISDIRQFPKTSLCRAKRSPSPILFRSLYQLDRFWEARRATVDFGMSFGRAENGELGGRFRSLETADIGALPRRSASWSTASRSATVGPHVGPAE